MTTTLTHELLACVRCVVEHTFALDSDTLPGNVYDARNRLYAWLEAEAIAADERDEIAQDAFDDLQPGLPFPLAWEIVEPHDEWEN